MPHVPPPPPPHEIQAVAPQEDTRQMTDSFIALQAQASNRRASLQHHKETRMEFSAATEAVRTSTPVAPEPLPSRAALAALASLEDSNEVQSLASAVMDPGTDRPVTFEESMAALRAQRVARKTAVREHKLAATECKVVGSRTTRRQKPPAPQ